MKTKKIVFIGMSAAMIVACKEVLSFLPNIELVTFLLMLYAISFDLSTSILVSLVFSTIEILLYGMGMWVLSYYIAWPMIVIITYLLKDKITKKADYMALLSGFFGITFGTVCALPYLLIGNLNTFISFIISGFSFDVIHMTGNFIIMLILYEPCRKAIQKLQTRM